MIKSSVLAFILSLKILSSISFSCFISNRTLDFDGFFVSFAHLIINVLSKVVLSPVSNSSGSFSTAGNTPLIEDLLAFSDKSDYAINAELLVKSQDDQNPKNLEGKPSPDGKGLLKLKRGIEVGHIFKLGKKYSESLNLKINTETDDIFPEMGCYGIGISRIVAASIEQNHDEKGILWPKELAPYQVALVEVNPKKSSEVNSICSTIYNSLVENKIDVLWDDRDQRAGVKFKDMELIGIPIFLIVGKKSIDENQIEVKIRKEDKSTLVPVQNAINQILRG